MTEQSQNMGQRLSQLHCFQYVMLSVIPYSSVMIHVELYQLENSLTMCGTSAIKHALHVGATMHSYTINEADITCVI